MKFLTTYYTLIILWLNIGCQNQSNNEKTIEINKFADEIIIEINEYKDQRNTAAILPFLLNNAAKYRKEAAFALASVGDSTAVPALMDAFAKENLNKSPEATEIQRSIALALFHCSGLLKKDIAENLLNLAVSNESKTYLLWAIGRRCSTKNMFLLDNELSKEPNDSLIKLGVIKAYYELCARKFYDQKMIATAINFCSSFESYEVRLLSSAFLARLSRIENCDLNAFAKEIYFLYRGETSAEVRMNLIQSLGLINGPYKIEFIKELMPLENDYRVLVAFLNSITQDEYNQLKPSAIKYLNQPNEHLSLAAASLISRMASFNSTEEIIDFIKITTYWRAKNKLLEALIATKTQSNEKQIAQIIIDQLNQRKNDFDATEMYTLLAKYTEFTKTLIKQFKIEKSNLAKVYCLDALATMAENSVIEGLNQHKKLIQHFLVASLKSPSGFEVYTAALHLQNDVFIIENKDSIIGLLAQIIPNWTLPRYFETRLELEKLNLKLQNLPYSDFKLDNPYNNPTDWNFVKTISKNQLVKLETNKGTIMLKLDVESAPSSVAYILKLINSGFYDNLLFHRVVSNFVVQGGDPDGNGTGGSEASIRTEHSFNEYTEGTIGLASAGKDTESCQFFITHNPTPHLNGRYTILGYVVSGLDVIQQLQVNDQIIRIEAM